MLKKLENELCKIEIKGTNNLTKSLKLHKCSYQKGTGPNYQPYCKHDRKILVRTKATLIFYDGCCQKESMKYADQKKVFYVVSKLCPWKADT